MTIEQLPNQIAEQRQRLLYRQTLAEDLREIASAYRDQIAAAVLWATDENGKPQFTNDKSRDLEIRTRCRADDFLSGVEWVARKAEQHTTMSEIELERLRRLFDARKITATRGSDENSD